MRKAETNTNAAVRRRLGLDFNNNAKLDPSQVIDNRPHTVVSLLLPENRMDAQSPAPVGMKNYIKRNRGN